MRFMVLSAPPTQSKGRGYEACPRVFASLTEAEMYRATLPASSRATTVAVVRPADAEDVWRNEHGCEFLFLYEYKSAAFQDTCVWLLDEDGIEVGIPKASFLKHFRQCERCSDCDGSGATCGKHWSCSTCKGTGRVKREDEA